MSHSAAIRPRRSVVLCGRTRDLLRASLVFFALLQGGTPGSVSALGLEDGEHWAGMQVRARLDPTFVESRTAASSSEDIIDLRGTEDVQQADELGEPFHLGGIPVPGQWATGVQAHPAVAFDGTNYLVVWHDYRSGSLSDIYCVRVSQSGSVLDPAGIAISTAEDYQLYPAVGFDGTNYLVVWVDYRSTSPGIYGARVSADGTVLDPNGLAIGPGYGHPAVAFDGANYLVVWATAAGDIRGARVTTSGLVLDPDGIDISGAANYQQDPVVAFDGTNCFVVWADNRSGSLDIYGARVSADGGVLDPDGMAISAAVNDQRTPALALDGDNCLVAWSDDRNGRWTSDIYCARVSTTGVLLDSVGIALSTAPYEQTWPAVTFDGANCLVVWIDNLQEVYGVRVNPAGTVIDTEARQISHSPSHDTNRLFYPALAFGGGNYLVTWNNLSDVYGVRMSQSGTVLEAEDRILSLAMNSQYSPAIASDGTGYLAVWMDNRNGSWDIYGTRIGVDGTVLDPDGMAICTAAYSQYYPAVAFDGDSYLVVWQDYRNYLGADVYGARVSVDGTVLDPDGIAICTVNNSQYYPVLAFGGNSYLVVWQDQRNSVYSDIYGARVSVEGRVLDPDGIAICTVNNSQSTPSVAFGGNNFLVVWEDQRTTRTPDVYGARVNTSGCLLDSLGIVIAGEQGGESTPAVASDGANYLVVWRGRDILGARVSAAGDAPDTRYIPISAVQNSDILPAVAFDGTDYMVVWQDRLNGPRFGVYGARISTDGPVLAPGPMAISSGQYSEGYPALAKGLPGALLITFHALTPAPYESYRIWGNIWGASRPVAGTLNKGAMYAYPNPFNPDAEEAVLKFKLSAPGNVTVKVFDASNVLVRTIVSDLPVVPGVESATTWNGRNDNSHLVANGVYIYVIESDSGEKGVGKVAVLR